MRGLAGCCTSGRDGYQMVRTVEAMIDENGQVSLLEDVTLPEARRALVTILEDAPNVVPGDSAVLSEAALAQDWIRPEEDEACSSLQPEL